MKKLILAMFLLSASLIVGAQQRQNNNTKLAALQNEKNQTVLGQKIKALQNGKAEDLELLIQYYSKDAAKKEAVSKKLLTKYPNTQIARNVRLASFLGLKSDDPAKHEALLQSMLKAYPKANLDLEKGIVAAMYGGIPNVEKMLQYANSIQDPTMRVRALIQAIQEVIPVDGKGALAVTAQELEQVKNLKDETAKSGAYYEYIDLYGKLLFNAGNDAEAYKYTTEAYNNLKNRDGQLTENFAFLSILNGKRYEESLPVLAKAVKDGKFEKKYLDLVRKAYTKLNPGKDASTYISELQKGFVEKVKAHASKLMINEAAPAFTVKDVNGNIVSLADFKGKTIVLDFWATWCIPCVASFPAMQLAVNRYKNDPDVKFLFIHTWENVKDPLTDAMSFLSKRDYQFDLYMDILDPVTKTPPAATKFKIDGIPAKFIIDGNGRIRFKVSGFEGKAEEAAEEVVQMVELARKSS